MVMFIQLARASKPTSYIQYAKVQMYSLLSIFVILTLVFGAFLYRDSPLLAVELAVGFALALLHPVNALCLFIHLLFLRPWEIVTDNTLLLALPRLLAM